MSKRSNEVYDFIAHRFGKLIVLIIWLVTLDGEKAVFYAPTDSECEAIAPHLAKLVPKIEELLHIPEVAHDAIINSDSITWSGLVILGYLDRIGVLDRIAPATTKLVDRFRNRSKNVPPPKQGAPVTQPGSNGNFGTSGPTVPLPPGIGAQYLPN